MKHGSLQGVTYLSFLARIVMSTWALIIFKGGGLLYKYKIPDLCRAHILFLLPVCLSSDDTPIYFDGLSTINFGVSNNCGTVVCVFSVEV